MPSTLMSRTCFARGLSSLWAAAAVSGTENRQVAASNRHIDFARRIVTPMFREFPAPKNYRGGSERQGQCPMNAKLKECCRPEPQWSKSAGVDLHTNETVVNRLKLTNPS